MDGRTVCRNGVDVAVYFAGNDSQYPSAWIMVYSGWRIVVYDWRVVLFVAQNEVLACGVAFVRNRGQCVFLFRRPVRVYLGFVRKPPVGGFLFVDFLGVKA